MLTKKCYPMYYQPHEIKSKVLEMENKSANSIFTQFPVKLTQNCPTCVSMFGRKSHNSYIDVSFGYVK